MSNESKVMKELHDIREKNYLETKHMSKTELVEYINTKAMKSAEDLRIKAKIKV